MANLETPSCRISARFFVPTPEQYLHAFYTCGRNAPTNYACSPPPAPILQRFALLLSHPPFYECFSSERTSCTSLAYPWRDWFNFTANRCRRCVIAVKLSPLGPLSAPLGTGLPRSRLPRCQLSPRCSGRYSKPHKPLDTAGLLACLTSSQSRVLVA